MRTQIQIQAVAVLLVALISQACGLRQFNGRLRNARVASTEVAAPFYAAGQGGNSMSPATCNTAAARPCIRARASVGVPFHFDVNPNDQNGIIVGTTYPVAPAPYAGTVEAGRTLGLGGVQDKKGGNYDLSIMKRQAGSGTYPF